MLAIVLVSVAAAALVVAGADRLLATLAGRKVARRLSRLAAAGGGSSQLPPEVRIASLPFLTQLAAGRYREVVVSVPALLAGGIEFRAVSAKLTMVRAPMRRLMAGRGVVAGQVTALATIPFSVISRRLPPGLAIRAHGSELRVSGFVLLMPVTGTLAVRAEGQRISVVPKVLGVPSLVAFVIPLPALPRELTIASLRVCDAGLELTMTGENIKLSPP